MEQAVAGTFMPVHGGGMKCPFDKLSPALALNLKCVAFPMQDFRHKCVPFCSDASNRSVVTTPLWNQFIVRQSYADFEAINKINYENEMLVKDAKRFFFSILSKRRKCNWFYVQCCNLFMSKSGIHRNWASFHDKLIDQNLIPCITKNGTLIFIAQFKWHTYHTIVAVEFALRSIAS